MKLGQHSSGGRPRLGSISKQGDRYLRGLFVAGALAVIRYPIQAEKLRPDREALGSATLATSAVASSGTDAWNAIEAPARLIGAVPCQDHSIKI
jgi:transposase